MTTCTQLYLMILFIYLVFGHYSYAIRYVVYNYVYTRSPVI